VIELPLDQQTIRAGVPQSLDRPGEDDLSDDPIIPHEDRA
jgi:hypothetical protein